MSKLKTFIQFLATLSIVLVPLWFATAALGSKFGLWSWKVGLGKMISSWGPSVFLTGLVIGLLAFVAALIKPRKGGGFILAMIAITIPAAGMYKATSIRAMAGALPAIHDITTDTQDVPVFGTKIMSERAALGRVNSADYIGKTDNREKEAVSVLQARDYPDIRPILSVDAPALAFEKSLDAVKALGWAVVDERRADGIIEATDTTFWFGFQDDIVIRIRPSEGGGSVIDMRSLSRVGGSDLGKNAQRIRDFRSRVAG